MSKNFINVVEIKRAIQWQPTDNESVILLKEGEGFLLAYFKDKQYQAVSFSVNDEGKSQVIDHEGFEGEKFDFHKFYGSIEKLTENCEGILI